MSIDKDMMQSVLTDIEILAKSGMKEKPDGSKPGKKKLEKSKAQEVSKDKDSHPERKKKGKSKKAKKEVKENVQAQPEIFQQPVSAESQKPGQVPGIDLRQAVLWSEILGDPVSVKRKKRRMEQAYGNQGYDRRR